ncbi:MAG: hypothetical protein Q3997_01360 [Propionibacteriaceae bacterium]|nr:hypothetical protein [Propionibacteriaceae bacterium]
MLDPEPAADAPQPHRRARFADPAPPEATPAAARRSAVSPASPPSAIPAGRLAAESASGPTGADEAAAETTTVTGKRPRWLASNGTSQFSRIFVAVTVLVVLALLLGLAYTLVWGRSQPAEEPSVSPLPPPVTIDDLWQPDELAPAIDGSSWHVSQSLLELSAKSPQVACLTAINNEVKPGTAVQRTLTAAEGGYAALHQIDKYSGEDEAKQGYAARIKMLASCDDTPAYIVGASTVSGIGNEAVQVTIAYEGATPEYHTVLVVRTGSIVSLFDLAHPASLVPAERLVPAAAAALSRTCDKFGTCPSNPTVTVTVPPAADPPGWLTPADWPRISPGSGKWTAVAPATLKKAATTCENLSLATFEGPIARQVRTFVLTEDPQMPSGFGSDEMLFAFPDDAAAATFAKTLGDNLAACGERTPTATVAEGTPVDAAAGDVTVTGRTFAITQAIDADTQMLFQVSVVQARQYVVYVVVNTPAAGFKLTPEQQTAVATRAGMRTTQLPS